MPVPPVLDKVPWAQALRAAAFLIENPDKIPEFREKFGLACARVAVGLAERHGLPSATLAQLKRDLGLEP
jgi:hypothetical protein